MTLRSTLFALAAGLALQFQPAAAHRFWVNGRTALSLEESKWMLSFPCV